MAKERTGDTQEQIDKCLTCDKFKCVNCYETKRRAECSKSRAGGSGNYIISEDVFCEMYQSGRTDREMADAFGVSRDAVARFRRRRNLKPNEGGRNECKTN